MRLFIILLTSVLIVSCKKEPEKNSQPKQVSPIESQYFSGNTLIYSDEEIAHISTSMFLKKKTLSTEHTELCIKNEQSRPSVQKACLLLWIQSGDKSEILEQFIKKKSLEDFFYASIVGIRPDLLTEFSTQDIQKLIFQLPTWTKIKIVKSWLSDRRPSLNVQEKKILLQIIRKDFIETPLALYEFGLITQKLDTALWSNLKNEYCDVNSNGLNRIRCWRFLSLFDAEISRFNEWRESFITFFPNKSSSEWKLFQKIYPDLARKIQLIT